jgi:hypothetical protein
MEKITPVIKAYPNSDADAGHCRAAFSADNIHSFFRPPGKLLGNPIRLV